MAWTYSKPFDIKHSSQPLRCGMLSIHLAQLCSSKQNFDAPVLDCKLHSIHVTWRATWEDIYRRCSYILALRAPWASEDSSGF
jgi:hypothetical protein